MNRRYRFIASLFAAFALVFAQFAVSAHACTVHAQPAKSEVMAHHEGCPGAAEPQQAPATDTLCAEHCQYGHASFDNASPLPAVANVTGPALRVEAAESSATGDSRSARRLAPAAAPPPPAILFGVLRI